MTALTGEQAANMLAATRIAVGIGAYLAPGVAARAFGTHAAPDPAVNFIVRTFGGRDVVLGVGLAGSVGRERDRWLVLGALVDAMDAAAALWGVARRQVPTFNGVAAALTASAAVATAAYARRR